ncbi:NAD(+)/NADH kinase [Aeoliella sp.]|uniref:NAD(+)/NADH kinase n=1 Tax=Aeoliella sp. TaxID=2795800 RepID=UPI003CCBCB1E
MSSHHRHRAVLVADGTRPRLSGELARLEPVVAQHLDVVGHVLDLADGMIPDEAELVVVFGGDGTMLRTAHLMGERQLPVLGVNLGKLGFLAHIRPEQLATALPTICNHEARVVDHLMFDCSLMRGGKVVETELGLNEASVLAGPPFSLIEVQLYVDAELATTYSCDGLIVSTPVGSTAHSLSAGGPILRKDLQAFVISPISPHTLTNRPVVDSAERIYELAVPEPNEGTTLIVDGRPLANIRSGDRVRIARSKATFKLLGIPDRGYYRTLREKLGWGGQLREEPPHS